MWYTCQTAQRRRFGAWAFSLKFFSSIYTSHRKVEPVSHQGFSPVLFCSWHWRLCWHRDCWCLPEQWPSVTWLWSALSGLPAPGRMDASYCQSVQFTTHKYPGNWVGDWETEQALWTVLLLRMHRNFSSFLYVYYDMQEHVAMHWVIVLSLSHLLCKHRCTNTQPTWQQLKARVRKATGQSATILLNAT